MKGLLKGLAVTVLLVGFGLWLVSCVSVEPTGRYGALLADPMANVEQLGGVEFDRRISDPDREVLGKPSFAQVSTVFVGADEDSVRRAADELLALAEEAGWVLPEDGVWERGYSLVRQIDAQDVNLLISVHQDSEGWKLVLWMRYRAGPPFDS